MAELVKNDNYVAEGLANALEQFKKKPKFEGWLTSYLKEEQELEDILFQIKDEIFDLDVAVGTQLDVVGAIIGEERFARLDGPYRIALRIRILVNTSGGEIDTLNTITDTHFAGALTFQFEELFPAAFFLRILSIVDDAPAVGIAQLATFIGQARGGGIAGFVLFAPTDPFQYDSGDGYDQGHYGTSVTA